MHLTGRAEIVDLDDELGRRFRDELERKYAAFRTPRGHAEGDGETHYATAMGGVVRFTPDARILNWDNRKLMG